MGLYDTYGPEKIQSKHGPCLLKHYDIGDDICIGDAIYIGSGGEGAFLVKGGKLIATSMNLQEIQDRDDAQGLIVI